MMDIHPNAYDKSHRHANFESSVGLRWCITYILQAGASLAAHTDAGDMQRSLTCRRVCVNVCMCVCESTGDYYCCSQPLGLQCAWLFEGY